MEIQSVRLAVVWKDLKWRVVKDIAKSLATLATCHREPRGGCEPDCAAFRDMLPTGKLTVCY